MLKRTSLLFIVSALCSEASAQYQGFGSVTRGAEDCAGYITYQVTSLANSGPGTLRDAVSANCRYITFATGGTITLTQTLLIQRSYLTIDGSSAPAPGITINTPGVRTALEASASIGPIHDVIIHHLRVQGSGGDQETADNFEMDGQNAPVYNIIFDHITSVAASDGNFDVWGEVRDVTLSHNLIRDTIKTSHFSRETPPPRERFSIYANVYARNNERQIRMRYDNRQIDIVNNVIYGWGWMQSGAAGLHLPSDAGYSPSINVENNYYYYVPGLSGSANDAVILSSNSFPGDIFFAGNVFPAGENDAVSTSSRIAIPSYAEVTKLPANQLGNNVVPCAGTHYPTAEEAELLRDISLAIGGAGNPCRKPSAPANLSVQ